MTSSGDLSRRQFIRGMAAAGLTLPSVSVLLAACGGGSHPGASRTPTLLIGTPDHPVTQPISPDNPPIDSGLSPEAGPLQLYGFPDLIPPSVIEAFESEYGVKVELATMMSFEEGTRKLASGAVSFDVFYSTAANVAGLVAGGLTQPLNLSYIPNLKANTWPSLASPYYDEGSHYSVPTTVMLLGIGWRTDMVHLDISGLENPWAAFWNPAVKGIAGLFNLEREAITVGLYYNGINNINTPTTEDLQKARDSLLQLVDLVDIRYTYGGSYVGLAKGTFGIHQAFAGDVVVGAKYNLPKGQDASVLQWVWPPRVTDNRIGGLVTNDCMVMPKVAKNPVLAHLWLNHTLDTKQAMENWTTIGQSPQKSFEAQSLVAQGIIPENLVSCFVTEEDFRIGQVQTALTLQGQKAWLDVWSQIQQGGA